MSTCKECEWFIAFKDGNAICCCPDQPKDNLPKNFPYKKVTADTIACKFFSREEVEMIKEKEKIVTKVKEESKIISALDNHEYIINDILSCVTQLLNQFKPILRSEIYQDLESSVEKETTSMSDIPLVNRIKELDNKLIEIIESLQKLSEYSGI